MDIQVYALLNHGRWLVRCPICPAAVVAEPRSHTVSWPVSATPPTLDEVVLGRQPEREREWISSHEFTCPECGTGPLPIRWPDAAEYEEATHHTSIRPLPLRNYDPMLEDPKNLLAENVAHGLVNL